MDKLQNFLKMFGIQHLNVPHLRRGSATKNNNCDDEPEQRSNKKEKESQRRRQIMGDYKFV